MKLLENVYKHRREQVADKDKIKIKIKDKDEEIKMKLAQKMIKCPKFNNNLSQEMNRLL